MYSLRGYSLKQSPSHFFHFRTPIIKNILKISMAAKIKHNLFPIIILTISAALLFPGISEFRSYSVVSLFYCLIIYLPVVIFRERVRVPVVVQAIMPLNFLAITLVRAFVETDGPELPILVSFVGQAIAFSITGVILAYINNFSLKHAYFRFQAVFIISFSNLIFILGSILEYALDLARQNAGILPDDIPITFGSMMFFEGIMLTLLTSLIIVLIYYLYLKRSHLKFISFFFKQLNRSNPFLTRDSASMIQELIEKGETDTVEFKSTLRRNLHTGQNDERIELAVMKTINAFLNSTGGHLFIGVDDKGKVLGLENDHFANNDQFLRHFTNLLNKYFPLDSHSAISCEIHKLKGGNVMHVSCRKSKSPVFMHNPNTEKFYIRNGPSSFELTGSNLVKYIQKNFKR